VITPQQIVQKCQTAYGRFLSAWIHGEGDGFFPLAIRANLKPIEKDLPATIDSVERLRQGSKETRGWGYSLHLNRVRSRDFGDNRFPERITIDTLDDLLRLIGRRDEFDATRRVAGRLKDELPGLVAWLRKHIRSIAASDAELDGLIAVTRFFLDHPWPDCYSRQIPVAVDTKFIERHQSLLRRWLDELLPASAVQADETTFAFRFGLRDGQPHRAVRLLDQSLTHELGIVFDEFSLPPRFLSQLSVRNSTVVVVENRLNLLTLPPLHRGIAIRGEGTAVSRLAKVPWLAENELVYWGDIDVEGFHILSGLRNLFPKVRSIMMDRETLKLHSDYIIDGNASKLAQPTNLTNKERDTLKICEYQNQRLEQERILQDYVVSTFESRFPLGFASQQVRVRAMPAAARDLVGDGD